MVRESKDSSNGSRQSAVENYTRAFKVTNSNWLLWVSVIYMPLGLYLGFVAQPLVWMLGNWASIDPQQLAMVKFMEALAWIALPLIGAIAAYYKLADQKN